jgi:hypothetical protein
MSDEEKIPIPNKVIAIPICWMLYECPANVFEILGASVSTPPPVVLEAMVESGLARRIKVISSSIHDEDDEEETQEEEEGPSDAKPWFPEQ